MLITDQWVIESNADQRGDSGPFESVNAESGTHVANGTAVITALEVPYTAV